MTDPIDRDLFSDATSPDPVYRDPTAAGTWDSPEPLPAPEPPSPPSAAPPQAPVTSGAAAPQAEPYRPEPYQPSAFQPEPDRPEPYRPESSQPAAAQPPSYRPGPDRTVAEATPTVSSPDAPSVAPVPASVPAAASGPTPSAASSPPRWQPTSGGTWSAPPAGSASTYPARPAYSSRPAGYARPGRNRRRRGGGGWIGVVVFLVVIGFSIVNGLHKPSTHSSSSRASSVDTDAAQNGIASSVQSYYLAAGGDQAGRAETYVCSRDRSKWRANLVAAGVDVDQPVDTTTVSTPVRSGDGYDTTVTVKLLGAGTETRRLHMVKEGSLWRICGGLI